MPTIIVTGFFMEKLTISIYKDRILSYEF
jgi:hypothetical protein